MVVTTQSFIRFKVDAQRVRLLWILFTHPAKGTNSTVTLNFVFIDMTFFLTCFRHFYEFRSDVGTSEFFWECYQNPTPLLITSKE